jgi:hypothetical protein
MSMNRNGGISPIFKIVTMCGCVPFSKSFNMAATSFSIVLELTPGMKTSFLAID